MRIRIPVALAALLVWPVLISAHGALSEQIAKISDDIGRSPENARLYLRRGALYSYHLEEDAAEKDYRHALALDSDLYECHLALGELYLKENRASEALVEADRYIERDDKRGDAWLVRARALRSLGRSSEAIEAYDRALATLSRPVPTHYIERAELELSLGPGHRDEALRGLDEGIRRFGPVVTLETPAIDLELAAGRYDEALERLDAMDSQYILKADIDEKRGAILALAGRRMEAASAYSEALASIASLPLAKRSAPKSMKAERRILRELERIDRAPEGKGRIAQCISEF